MPNSYFQFKKFRIEQGTSAMKVTTDACILGAWTPILPAVGRVLDIGTGTGLLALMLAQKNNDIIIEGIEIEPGAALQAGENVAASFAKNNITIVKTDILGFTGAGKYGLIITNPPFFINSLKGNSEQKNLARHNTAISFEDLLAAMDRNLTTDGYISILLPFDEQAIFERRAIEKGFVTVQKLLVHHTSEAKAKRVITILERSNNKICREDKLVIYNNDNTYTTGFQELMAPYYLNLA